MHTDGRRLGQCEIAQEYQDQVGGGGSGNSSGWESYREIECVRIQVGTGVLHLALVLEAEDEAAGLEHELLRIDSFELR